MEAVVSSLDFGRIGALLDRGGPALWVIAGLSVITLALILWKVWRLWLRGAWGGARTDAALAAWASGDVDGAEELLRRRRSIRAKITLAAMKARRDPRLTDETAREETTRLARRALAEASSGLRALDLIATIAPLLGLLGTVLGMIEAFQALQETGQRADPTVLAGGIWEALLTTAAGMAVAIPAAMALAWFEGIIERLRLDMEDAATRVFTRGPETWR